MKRLLEIFKDKNIDADTRWGAIFGVASIVAILAEVCLSGFTAEAIVSGIKDITGTLVAIAVFLVAVKSLLPKETDKTFEEKLTDELNKWIKDHSNMIVKTSKMREGHKNDFGMSMTTDISRFYETAELKTDGGNNVGRFLRITEINESIYKDNNVKLEFFLNTQTYCSKETPPEKAIEELMNVGNSLSVYIKGIINGIKTDKPHKDDQKTVIIPITFAEPIVSDNDDNIDLLINVIDRMYEAMLVSAKRK